MFGSQILDVAIGIIFIYLLVSLIVSVVNEWIVRLFSLRASTLEDGLRNMLQDPHSSLPGATSLVDELYNHPLIQGLSPLRSRGRLDLPFIKTPPVGTQTRGLNEKQGAGVAPPAVSMTRWAAPPASVAQGGEGQGVAEPTGTAESPATTFVGQAATRTGRPSYIDPRNFSLALLDIVAPKGTHSKNIEGLREEISTSLVPNQRLQRTLLTIVDTGEATLQSARAGIETWFNDGMDRITGWYKRKVQLITLAVGVLLAILLNVDTFAIVRTLWTQPTVRDALARSAEQYVQGHSQDSLDVQRQNIETSLGERRAFNLPIGWSGEAWSAESFPSALGGQPIKRDPRRLGDVLADWGLFLSKLPGLLLTGAAVSLGAQFWFDTLSRVTSLRSTGNPPSTDDQKITSAGA